MTFKVTYQYLYPDSDKDIRVAFVLADSFEEALSKTIRRYKGEFESASVQTIEFMEADIIV